MGISRSRGALYKLARLLGDLQALSSGDPGKISRRAGRRTAGKAAGRGLRKLFK